MFENVSESGSCRIPPICAEANYMWLQSVTLDTTDHRDWGNGAMIEATHVAFDNVDMFGQFPSVHVADDFFTYSGGVVGDADPPADCEESADGKIQTQFVPSNMTIENIRFNPIDMNYPTCEEAHKETIRLQDQMNNTTIRNNWFVTGSDSGSGHIFCGGAANPTNLHVINNFFGSVIGSYWTQCSNGAGMVVAYNTFAQEAAFLDSA